MSWWIDYFRPITYADIVRLEGKLDTLLNKETQDMAIGETILTRVTAQTTLIGSVITLIQELKASGDITPEVEAAILAKLDENDTALEAALAAGTTPPPTPTPEG